MRLLLLTTLTIALAWGVWTLLVDSEAPRSDLPRAEDPETPPTARTPLPADTVTLVLTVRTPDGRIPASGQAGYEFGGEDRLRRLDEAGRVTYTDAPTGSVTLVAVAPGYERIAQKRYLNAGLRTDAILTLKAPAQAREGGDDRDK